MVDQSKRNSSPQLIQKLRNATQGEREPNPLRCWQPKKRGSVATEPSQNRQEKRGHQLQLSCIATTPNNTYFVNISLRVINLVNHWRKGHMMKDLYFELQ
jgi:hypothetical protein